MGLRLNKVLAAASVGALWAPGRARFFRLNGEQTPLVALVAYTYRIHVRILC